MSRRGCALGCAAWLALMLLPALAGLLAMNGELAWRRGPLDADRVWIVNGLSGYAEGQASGLAYEATRRHPQAGPLCARTRVVFWLWRGRSENATYCECFQANPAGGLDSLGACP